MLSSDDDDDVVAAYSYIHNKNRKQKRKCWVHPYIKNNKECNTFMAARELSQHEQRFQSFYRMSKDSFNVLVEKVKPLIERLYTNFRRCVSVEERILITLRYLATGCTFTALSFYFARGESTIGNIVADTTNAIWTCLQPDYMPLPDTKQWKSIANRFYELWNLPHCVGNIDGKHILIQKLPNSGSTNFHYKSYHSIVLIACADADGNFVMIEVGYAGRNSDGGVFRASRIWRWLEGDGLNLPESSVLPHDAVENHFPYFFVGDEAFPLKPYLMRPYPKRILDNKKRVFNYRLSRGRKCVECSFGMMMQKFQVLMTPIRCTNENTINSIIQCVCVLHNFIRKREGRAYTPNFDIGERGSNSGNVNPNTDEEFQNVDLRGRLSAQLLRDYLSTYFLKPETALPWQWKYWVNA